MTFGWFLSSHSQRSQGVFFSMFFWCIKAGIHESKRPGQRERGNKKIHVWVVRIAALVETPTLRMCRCVKYAEGLLMRIFLAVLAQGC